MRTIEPGESLVYQFQGKHAGAFMYHCGTDPTLHHIGTGMAGAIIIDPPGLPVVDHEYLFVQSELYLGPWASPATSPRCRTRRGTPWSSTATSTSTSTGPSAWNPVNGSGPGWSTPAPRRTPRSTSGAPCSTGCSRRGAYQLRPGAGRGGAQPLDLQPAQGGFVEFTFDESGLYPIVTHKLANVGKGALGLFQAGDVDTAGSGSH
jgi:nitrite reductase (NO-forming)